MQSKLLALVTGATGGLGQEIAYNLASQKIDIIASARDPKALKTLRLELEKTGIKAIPFPMDLSDPDDIDKLSVLLEEVGKLDILIGNGAMLGTRHEISKTTTDIWAKTFQVNVHANQHLIRLCTPYLLESDAGRAYFVTSRAAEGARANWSPYAASKAALNCMVLGWAEEVKDTNLRVNLLDPGIMRTKMRAQAYPEEDPMTLPLPKQTADKANTLITHGCPYHGHILRA